MGFIKNVMIVFCFSFVIVSMIFWGVTMIEAKAKQEVERTALTEVLE